jgi:uncharacterized protein DUF6894
MQRYFFDVSSKGQIQYDYSGRDLSFEQAKRLAELIALDVQCTQGDDIEALEVQVRDIKGRHLFSVPIDASDLAAA